ncbi:MAG: hypothetical protein K9M82_00080 [Deltaproteobacteria bacterium]|nr:hypothetical protein [Deltaproteobacteria bacterium]
METDAQKVMLESWRYRVQHRTNPLHVYCRLVDLGMGRFLSRKVCVLYERLIFPPGRREWRKD